MPNEDRKKELDTLLNEDSQNEQENKDKNIEDKNKEENKDAIDKIDENEKAENEKSGEEENKKENQENSKKEELNNEAEDSGDEEDSENEASKQKDRWHGKSREDVIRMYEEIEKKPPVNEEAPNSEIEKSDKAQNTEDEVIVPSNEELSKMTPKQFAEWVVTAVKNIVDKTYDTRSRMRDSVAQEIQEAQKNHPLLKASPEYRELVLSLIDSASQKGIVMPLKEACAKVDGFAGKVKGDTKISDTEKIRLKKAKAQVERGAGAPASPGEDKSAEERRLEGIFGTSRSKSPLGGLGV